MRKKRVSFIILFVSTIFSCLLFAENQSFQMTVQQKYLASAQPEMFSPDGKYLLTVSTYTGSPKLWDIKTGQIIRNVPLGNPYNMYFSPDSQFLVISDYDQSLQKYCLVVYNIQSGKIERQILNFYAASVFSNEELVAYDKVKNTVVLINYKTGKEIKTLFLKSNRIAVSHDSKMIVECIPGSKSCTFYELKTLRKIHFAPIETGSNTQISFTPDNRVLLVQLNWVIMAHDMQTGKIIYSTANKIQGKSLGKIYSQSVDFANNQLIVGYETRQLVWYSIQNGSVIKNIQVPEKCGYMKTAANPAGNFLALGSADPEILIYDTKSLKVVKKLTGVYSGEAIMSVALSPDGKRLASSSDQGAFKIYDLENLRIMKRIKMSEESLNKIEYSLDGNLLAVASARRILVFNAKNYQLKAAYGGSFPFCFSRDSKYIISAGKGGELSIIDLEMQKVQRKITINEKESQIAGVIAVSPDRIHFAVGVYAKNGPTVYIYDLNQGKLAYTLPGHKYHTDALAFSPDGKQLASGSYSHEVKIWNLPTKKEAASFPFDAWTTSLSYTGDGKYLLASGGTQWGGGKIGVFDSRTRKMVKILENHAIGVTSMAVSSNGKYFVSGSYDSTEKIWKTDVFEPVTLLAKDEENWFFYSDDGYFDSSLNGGDFLMMVKGLSCYGVEQFAIKFNRPDILMKKIGLADGETISFYQGQYLKRIKKSGFTENLLGSDFHVPEVRLLSSSQDGKTLSVSFEMADSRYKIKSYNLYVNGVPEYGAYGKPAKCLMPNSCRVSVTEKIELNAGRNRIEISCLNEKGAESFRVQTIVDYSQAVRGRIVYVGLGVSRYKDSRLNLHFADKDAVDLAALFKAMAGKIKFEDGSGNLIYTNESATLENISKIREYLKDVKVDDTLILFISGHGIHDKDKENTYYYLPYEAEISRLRETAANFDVFEEILMSVKARKKLFLMDTCESGEAEEEWQRNSLENREESPVKPRTVKGLNIAERQTSVSSKKSRKYLYQRDRYIFNDLLKRSGAIVFSSSRGGEYSYEDQEIQNGFFTKAILDFFHQNVTSGVIQFQHLKDYVVKTVSEKSEKLFAQGKIETPQHPTVDRNNLSQIIELEGVR